MSARDSHGGEGDVVEQSLVDILVRRAQRAPGGIPYVFAVDLDGREEQITYAELDRRARAVAAILEGLGEPGDRGVLLFPPGLDYIVALLGCLYAGVIAVPAYPPDPARFARAMPRLKAILADAKPRLALTTTAVLDLTEQLTAGDPAFAGIQWIATDTIDAAAGHGWAPRPAAPGAVALLQYTSGSTRQPRGVMLTHENLLSNLEVQRRGFGMDGDDQIVSWLPPYHDMGLIGAIMVPLYTGTPAYMLSPMHFLQRPSLWLNAASRRRATMIGGPNFAYELAVRKVSAEQRKALDLSSVAFSVVSAEPVRSSTLEQFADAFGPCGFDRRSFFPCYGLAEATLLVTQTPRMGGHRVYPIHKTAYERRRVVAAPLDAPDRLDLVGSGFPCEGLVVVVVDPESRRVCAEDEVGEIWISGPSIAMGYWDRPDETRETFGATLGPDGGDPGRRFLRSGDLGFFHGRELVVSGRAKDLIIIRGRNHYPQDIEASVDGCHPRVRRGCSAAFAFPDPEADGERLGVVVEVAQGAAGDPENDAILQAVRRVVFEEHEVRVDGLLLIAPRGIHKTSSGKIQRSATRAAFLAGELPEVARAGAARPRSDVGEQA
jgi:acyl-CoA synthetase (AMP-forming)/AMP-acid ligase II